MLQINNAVSFHVWVRIKIGSLRLWLELGIGLRDRLVLKLYYRIGLVPG